MTFPIIPASTVNGSYRVTNSLRFRSSASAYLKLANGTPTSARKWTWSAWVKRGALGAQVNISGAGQTSGTNYAAIIFNSNGTFQYNEDTSTTTYSIITTQVFRDPSAWYHIVLAVDTTSATNTITGGSTDRIRLYINGSQVSSFSTTAVPAQNYDTLFNSSGYTKAIGNIWYNNAPGGFYFDGYLAEVNFIDGFALLPTAFGAFDTNGVWQPARYTGSYTGNSFYLPFSASATSSYSGAFTGNNSNGIYSPANSAFTFTGDFTVEFFAKLNAAATSQTTLLAVGPDGGGLVMTIDNATQKLYNYINSTGNIISTSTALLPNVYYHIAWVRGGATNTLYINGISQGTYSFSGTVNSGAVRVGIGNYSGTGTVFNSFNGSISNVRIVKGTAVYTSNFSVPTSNLTAVTNTQLLTLQNSTLVDNSANAFTMTNTGPISIASDTPFIQSSVGSDASGAGNNWLLNNVQVTSSTLTTYDSMIDSPTNYADGGNGRGNYATVNPLFTNGSPSISSANLNVTGGSTQSSVSGTIGASSGKYYAEFIATSIGSNTHFGVFALSNNTNGANVGPGQDSRCIYRNDGGVFTSSQVGTYASYTTSNTIGVALNLDASPPTVTFYKDNTSQGTVNLSTSFSNWTFAMLFNASSDAAIINFGQRPFTYTPPSGFSALNTQNLPTPTIAAGNKYFDVLPYTGNATLTTRTGLNLSSAPGLVWIKSRSYVDNHVIEDSVRGTGVVFTSISTAAEGNTGGGWIQNLSTTGFSTDVNTQINTNAATYVSWVWAGGSNVTNTSGSITSTVSANTSAGFSVVTYTGTGATGTVGHGLGVAPSMVITKKRSSSGDEWVIWHVGLTSGTYILLFTTAAQFSSTQYTAVPSSTVLNLNTATAVNNSGSTYVSYVFAPVSGYSAFGSYTGNGASTTDGPFTYLGFRPRFLLVKRSDSTGSWLMFDSSRDTYNPDANYLIASSSAAEAASGVPPFDFLSNGFKCRATVGAWPELNTSGATVIYAAFAETPFKFSRSR